MYILLIDDDPISLFLTTKLLKRETVSDTVASFQSPVEGLVFLQQHIATELLPRLIFLDLNMPIMDGWAFLDNIHRNEHQLLHQCSVYLLTSSLATVDTVRAGNYPLVAGVIHKPLDRNDLHTIQVREHMQW